MVDHATVQRFEHDLYAPLNHVIGNLATAAQTTALRLPTWLPESERRRIMAYRVLAAYPDNVRRYWLPEHMWQGRPITGPDGTLIAGARPPAESYREYGYAALLLDTCRAIVLGDEQTIVGPPPPEPELVEVLDDDGQPRTGPDGEPLLEPGEVVDPAAEVVEWVRRWATRAKLTTKLIEGETHAIGLGDGVYALGWQRRQGRPWLRVYDPGFYFPEWDAVDDPAYAEWDDDDFPPVVHLAWELERDGDTIVRRTTYRMTRLDEPREVPWGGTSQWTCVMSIRDVGIRSFERHDLFTLPDSAGTEVLAPTDLLVDFVPVVHVTNDVAGGNRFGRSIFLRVAQQLDDLAGGDTDLASNAQTVASPPTVTRGATNDELAAGPGAWWGLQAEGSAAILDTSRSLDALLKYVDRLEDGIAQATRIALATLGKVAPSEVPSGYALRLGFAPTQALLRELRLVRGEKYPLVLRFALRLAQANDPANTPAGETPELEVALGPSLPSDRGATVTEVRELLREHAISVQTGVRMLVEAGLPIDDAELEVERILAQRTEDMVRVVEALGDEGMPLVRQWLGLDEPVDEAGPADDDEDPATGDVVLPVQPLLGPGGQPLT